jgi:hypothetical protein
MTIETYDFCRDQTMRPQHSPNGRVSSRSAFFAIVALSLLAWAPIVLPLVALFDR